METSKVITITFSDIVESHVGMAKLGTSMGPGFTYDELSTMYNNISPHYPTEFYQIALTNYTIPPGVPQPEPAYLLVIRGYATNKDALYNELLQLPWDTKAWMKGKVVEKRARHNLCYTDEDQEPDYENKKGRVVNFSHVPNLSTLRESVCTLTNRKKLLAEGNYYYDVNTTGLSYHGDGERNTVIGVRLGDSHLMPLYFQWYHRFQPVGTQMSIVLNGGDVYVMSSKTVGTDWKKSSILTLRHATGAVGSKYVTPKIKK